MIVLIISFPGFWIDYQLDFRISINIITSVYVNIAIRIASSSNFRSDCLSVSILLFLAGYRTAYMCCTSIKNSILLPSDFNRYFHQKTYRRSMWLRTWKHYLLIIATKKQFWCSYTSTDQQSVNMHYWKVKLKF